MATKNSKVVLVTGANKGLGKEIGRQLGVLGYTVVLTARDKQAGCAAELYSKVVFERDLKK